MSHFSVYVFSKLGGKSVEQLLAPFDEEIVYEPYIELTREQAIAKTREEIELFNKTRYAEFLKDPEAYKEQYKHAPEHLKYIEHEFPKRFKWTDEECYQYQRKWYDDDRIDEEGNLYSTYNPNSKWDWYEVGGRWTNSLTTKDARETNEDYVNEINWKETDIPFAFITPNGEWHEKGEMGWWAFVSNEKDQNNWDAEFKKAIEELDDDAIVTVVDCHI